MWRRRVDGGQETQDLKESAVPNRPGKPNETEIPTKGAKVAVDRWKKDGDRDDQDYYHIPGSPERDHEEVHSSTRDGKSRKS
jgi:hypothetical protein